MTYWSLKEVNEKKQQIFDIASDILSSSSLNDRLLRNEIDQLKAIVNKTETMADNSGGTPHHAFPTVNNAGPLLMNLLKMG